MGVVSHVLPDDIVLWTVRPTGSSKTLCLVIIKIFWQSTRCCPVKFPWMCRYLAKRRSVPNSDKILSQFVCFSLFELIVHPSRTTRRTFVPSPPFQSVQRNPSKFHPSSFLCEIETILLTLPTRPNKQHAFTLIVPSLRTINRPILINLNVIVKLNH